MYLATVLHYCMVSSLLATGRTSVGWCLPFDYSTSALSLLLKSEMLIYLCLALLKNMKLSTIVE
jgi:hypothetical protein